jgi:arsenate reductase
MAEGFLNHLYRGRYVAFSAGTEPSKVHPTAIKVMKEVGIDISNHRSKSVEKFIDKDIDYVVTVCDKAKQTCPFFPGGRETLHKSFEDPSQATGSKEEVLDTFRRIRNEIKRWIEKIFF